MIPHNMPLFKFICALYQFHHQTLPIMKIDRGQIQFRDYVFTGTEPKYLNFVFIYNFLIRGRWTAVFDVYTFPSIKFMRKLERK